MSKSYFAVSARTAIGLARSGNEDSALTSSSLLAVADGMGGHAGGEVASQIAIKTLATLVPVFTAPDIDTDSIEDLLLNSLHTIDGEISRVASDEIELRGMGTTLTALLIRDGRAALLHVGDSRCYRLRGNTFEQLTHDHTVLQELLDSGTISMSEAADHPQRSMLTQVLMGEGSIAPVLMVYEVNSKDRFLLCSDGLSSVLTEKEIKSLLKKSNRDEAVEALVEATYVNGAPDNVTVVVADVIETEEHEVNLIGAAQ
ncbi:MAG: PP2C family protein-serine/threonine phosphatase [Candidatus Planktophila sp.]|jgi:serine/threonine protein phosphatase PrpC